MFGVRMRLKNSDEDSNLRVRIVQNANCVWADARFFRKPHYVKIRSVNNEIQNRFCDKLFKR